MRALAVLTVAILAACGVQEHTIRIDGVQVRCEGELTLTADECARWGEELLEEPTAADSLVITTSAAAGSRCSADFASGGQVLMTASIPCAPPSDE